VAKPWAIVSHAVLGRVKTIGLHDASGPRLTWLLARYRRDPKWSVPRKCLILLAPPG